MSDFLLELLSEEIPARMQDRAREELARLFAGELAKAGIAAGTLTTYATPRRLALIAHDLPDATEPVREETKGPRASAPPQALDGFLRKTGLAREQLVERDGVLFAIVERPGRAIADVLADAIPAIIRAFAWPKSMRWGSGTLRWVRPLRGILALFGSEVVPCAIEGIESGAATLGHRFHHPGIITIGSARDYVEKLRACHVIVDHEERRAIVSQGAERAAAAQGLTLIPDEGLVIENAGLTEWPVPLLGSFDPAFLDVPREVIQLTMRTNQKYFACADQDGRLAPAFICTANIEAADGGAAIVAGNRKVLAARLADAKFFWEQDRKITLEEQARKLGQIVFHEKLGTVADKVDRVAKLARWLVEEGVVKPLSFGGGFGAGPVSSATSGSPHPPSPSPEGGGEKAALADMAEQAARLCKADLVTGMVGEFPELQGVMGGYYARAEGLPGEVADAIRDHYKPVGQGDEVPTAPVTVAVSLADKLDTLANFFFVDLPPTGSKDPFALRRAALSVLSLIVENYLSLPLKDVLTFAMWPEQFESLDIGSLNERIARINETNFEAETSWGRDALIAEIESLQQFGIQGAATGEQFLAARQALLNFFADRLKVQQREAGVGHDLIDAVFALGGEDDLVRLLARVKALQAFVSTEDGVNLLAGYKRASNILRKENWTADAPAVMAGPSEQGIAQTGEEDPLVLVDDPIFADVVADLAQGAPVSAATPAPAEAALATALDRAEAEAAHAVAGERFEEAMAALSRLRAPIDAFFEAVTVNDPDPATRAARLRLLGRVREAVHRVADFSKIEG